MKITDVRVFLVNQFAFVKVYTDEGIIGLGESGAWAFLQASESIVNTVFKGYLLGKNPLDIERHWQFMSRASHFRGAAFMGAISAIDIALWDIAGKYYNVPVWRLLGGQYRNKVRVYCHAKGKTLQELVDKCKEVVHQGFNAVGHVCPFLDEPMNQIYDKTYIKRVTDAVNVIAGVREAVGDGVDICVEANKRMNVGEAIVFGREIEQFYPYFYEDPVKPDNFDEMAEVAKKVSISVATGERLHTPQEFQMLLNRGAAQFLRTSITLCGGITGTRKIAALAEANGVQLVPHNPLSPVCTAVGVQIGAATPSVAILEYPDDHRIRTQPGTGEKFPLSAIVTNTMKVENGYLIVPDAPGIGIDLVKDVDKKFPFSQYPPELRPHVDGSFWD